MSCIRLLLLQCVLQLLCLILGLLLCAGNVYFFFFFFQAEDGIRDYKVTGVQTCALPIWSWFCLGLVSVFSGVVLVWEDLLVFASV